MPKNKLTPRQARFVDNEASALAHAARRKEENTFAFRPGVLVVSSKRPGVMGLIMWHWDGMAGVSWANSPDTQQAEVCADLEPAWDAWECAKKN